MNIQFLAPIFEKRTSANLPGHLIFTGQTEVFKRLAEIYGARFLNVAMTTQELTPLMIAVLCDQQQLATYILDRDITQLNMTDTKGFTAGHLAAFKADRSFLNFLFSKGFDRSLRENNGGTAEDIYLLTHPKETLDFPIYFEDSTISPERYRELTGGAVYLEEHRVKPETFLEIWHTLKFIPAPGTERFIPQYDNLKKNPPRISFKQTSLGNTAFTLDALAKGTLVTEYLGEYDPFDTRKINCYTFARRIHCHTYRGAASLIQDGTPNLAPLSVITNGLPRTVFVALRAIKEGETLYFNYGNHEVKYTTYTELNPEELREWLSQGKLEEMENKSAQNSNKIDLRNIDHTRDVAIFQFLQTTPAVLLTLFLEKKLTSTQLLSLLSKDLPPSIQTSFKGIAENSDFSTTPREISFRNYVLGLLRKGSFILATILWTDQKNLCSKLDRDTALSAEKFHKFLGIIHQRLTLGLALKMFDEKKFIEAYQQINSELNAKEQACPSAADAALV